MFIQLVGKALPFLVLPKLPFGLQAFSVSDCVSCPYSRRSITGYILLLGNHQFGGSLKNKALNLKIQLRGRIHGNAAAKITLMVMLLDEFGVKNLTHKP